MTIERGTRGKHEGYMKKKTKWYNTLSDALTPRVIAVILCGILILSLLPILYCSFFVRATGDDLAYSAALHRVMIHGGSLADALEAIRRQVVQSWYGYQGTWSSIILFQLQPGIWGDAVYAVTPWISLGMIAAGTWCFLREVLCRHGGFRPAYALSIFSILLFCSIQYIPKIRGGIFWYTSVAHYCIPYGVALFCVSSALAFLRTGRRRSIVGASIGCAYLGGAGYPPIVLAACLLFLLILTALFSPEALQITGQRRNMHEKAPQSAGRIAKRTRGLLLLIPFLLLMAGFIVSAIAPGNKVRGGEDFGFSEGRVLSTLRDAFADGLKAGPYYLLHGRMLPLCFLLIAILTWSEDEREKWTEHGGADMTVHAGNKNFPQSGIEQHRASTRGASGSKLLLMGTAEGNTVSETITSYPPRRVLWMILSMFITLCMVRAPRIYAAVGVSGGVPDTEYFTFLLMVCLMEITAVLYLKDVVHRRHSAKWENSQCGNEPEEAGGSAGEVRFFRRVRTPFLLAVLLFCLVFSRHLIGQTADYLCVNFITSGQLRDYRTQMQEWLDILHDPAIRDAKLPAMNSEQGPYMIMVPLPADNPGFSNYAYEQYFEKDSVVSVPREGR